MFHAAKFAPQAQNAMPLAKWGRQAVGGLAWYDTVAVRL